MASKQQSGSSKQTKPASSHTAGSTAKNTGGMSVREAGYKGGQRVRELVSEGRQNEKRVH